MTFDKIVEHLGKRGFVTRKKWMKGCLFIYFGMDNVFTEVHFHQADIFKTDKDEYVKNYYLMCLDDILADDWEIVDCFWDGSNDDLLPFGIKDPKEYIIRFGR
jgi:hypothetical protein